MRLRDRILLVWQYIVFAFYPQITLWACTIFFTLVLAILIIAMVAIPHTSVWYNIVFALTTGVAGSFFVSIILELANNYKHNKLAWYELQNYYSAVEDYEIQKQVVMQLTPVQRAVKKAHEEYVAAGGIEDVDKEDQPKDVIQITWNLLPKLIPVFKQTIDNKKEFLNEEEINALNNILSEYKQIQFHVRDRILKSPMTYDALNHPDEDYLKTIYPKDVLGNIPKAIRRHLASDESQKGCERFADAILSDAFLLSLYMRNYDISQKGLDDYKGELDRIEQEETKHATEDIDYDELAFSEPEDEKTFRAQHEEINIQMELKFRPFVSWHISKCCLDISKEIDILEKIILDKPYYGMMIKYYRDSAKEPLDDPLTMISYEREKRQLDKRLAKQRGGDSPQ